MSGASRVEAERQAMHSLQRARDEFAAQPFMRHLGAEVSSVSHGRLTVVLPIHPAVTQQHGFVHAGALSAVMDTACGFAALTTVQADRTVLTAEFKINLLRPALGHVVRVNAEVIRQGRSLIVCQATATCESLPPSQAGDSEATDLLPTAIMTATLASIQPPRPTTATTNGAAPR